ncbi:MAG: L,D-transpeptidase [Pseudonocardia sp.]|nr:L,D-transpeptidase [Pseudonocardia sp.]
MFLNVLFAGTASAGVSGRARAQASDHDRVRDTPCGVGTVACVALGRDGFGARAWLIRGSEIVKGPVPATSGGPGKETPFGTFEVLSKDINHVSTETHDAQGNPSPMPYSVFFTPSGVAFHGGGDRTARTAGCVRLATDDAQYFFNNLEIGDRVQVVDGAGFVERQPPDRSSDGGLLGGL